jgi:hypothetical protein
MSISLIIVLFLAWQAVKMAKANTEIPFLTASHQNVKVFHKIGDIIHKLNGKDVHDE